MRIALALASCITATALAGCLIDEPSDDGYYDYGSGGSVGSGWGGGSGAYDLGCHVDADCGGLVCTRTGECLAAADVRAVHTTWTVSGRAATVSSCTNAPDLSITFTSGSEEWGYTPVPCEAGKHTIDKFPKRFTGVQLARAYDYGGGVYGTFDTAGNALLNLPY